MRFLDQKNRTLMVDKVPCKCLYSVWLCYRDGRVRRTVIHELRSHNSRREAEAALKRFAKARRFKRA